MPHRLFTLAEVAEYLHLPEKDVEQMTRHNEIPHETLGKRLVFRRAKIDAWASKRLLDEGEKHLDSFHLASSERRTQPHDLSSGHAIIPELMGPGNIHLDMQRRSKPSTLREMVEYADQTGMLLEPIELLESLEERERQGSTALSGGVALLHPEHHMPYMFQDSFIVFARSIQRIPFGAPNGRTTDLFFLICCQDDAIHLHVLARICMMCHNTSLLLDLRETKTPDDAYALLCATEQEVIDRKLH